MYIVTGMNKNYPTVLMVDGEIIIADTIMM
jgi:hypothetical protein